LPDQAGEDAPCIQAQERHAEHTGRSFGRKAFATARNPQHQHAFRHWKPVLLCPRGKRFSGFEQPLLQQVEAADRGEGLGSFDQFEQPVLLYGLGLFPRDDARVQGAGFHHRERKGILGLGGGQAAGRIDQRGGGFRRGPFLPGGFEDAAEHLAQRFRTGQGEVHHDELALEFRRKLQPAAEHGDRVTFGLPGPELVLQLPEQQRVRVVEEQMVIAQEHDAVFRQLGQDSQDLHRVLGTAGSAGGGVDQAGRGRPGVEPVLQVGGDGFQLGFDALFLVAHEVEAGVPGPDVMGDFLTHGFVSFFFSYWLKCWCSHARQTSREGWVWRRAPPASRTSHCWLVASNSTLVARRIVSRPMEASSIASV
jgi:hypothetical protein